MGLRITTRRSHVALVITRALAVGLLVGCSTAPATSPAMSPSAPSDGTVSPPPPSADATPTPWDTEVADLDNDGTRSLGSALLLMAMAFGPIPGVEATLAAPGTVGSASPAVRAIRAHLDELTPAQREAVDRYLTIPSDAKRLEVPPAGGSISPRGGTLAVIGPIVAAGYPYTRFEEEVLADATSARTRAAGYFGDMPGLGIHITHMPDEPFVTFFNPTAGAGGVEQCDVIVNSAHNDDRFVMRRAMTLDIVHCFQSRALGTEAGFAKQVPAWAWEGPAQFINLASLPDVTHAGPAEQRAQQKCLQRRTEPDRRRLIFSILRH